MFKDIKAVIFDMDGVLIDSEDLHYEKAKRVCLDVGINLERKEYDLFVGTPSNEMWQAIIGRYNLKQDVKFLEAKEDYLQEVFLKQKEIEIPLVEGIEDFLAVLFEKGFVLGVASSAKMDFIEQILQTHGLQKYFQRVVSSENIVKGKPSPDIFIYTAGALGVNVGNCLVIEDSKQGIKAAKEAGMKAIGFVNVKSGKQDLSLADLRVTSYKELRQMI